MLRKYLAQNGIPLGRELGTAEIFGDGESPRLRIDITMALRQSSGEISNRLNSIFSQSAGLEEGEDVSPVCEQNSHDRLDNEYCKN